MRWATSGHGNYTFIRFEVPPLPATVLSDKLRVRTRSAAIPDLRYYHVDMPAWQETGLTWATTTAVLSAYYWATQRAPSAPHAAQIRLLRRLVLNDELPPNPSSLLSGVSLARNLHFLLWDGIRLTVLEPTTPNRNNRVIFGMLFYERGFFTGDGETHLASPWNSNSNISPGSSTLDLINHLVVAAGHYTSQMPIPSAPPKHHLVVGPSGLQIR